MRDWQAFNENVDCYERHPDAKRSLADCLGAFIAAHILYVCIYIYESIVYIGK